MKLLLTSAGIRNQTIATSLQVLCGRPIIDVRTAFITTAANVEAGDKGWFISQIINLKKFGYEWIDLIDISAPGVDWRARLGGIDVIVMSGGNTFHLLDQVRRSGFDDWLKEHLNSLVYVGISAGSIIATPSIAIASIDNGDVNVSGITDLTGLSIVPFEVSPHTPESVSHDGNKAYKASIQNELYGLDDESAIQIVDDAISIISEGKWVKY